MILVAFAASVVAAGLYLGVGWDHMASQCGSFDYLSSHLPDVPNGGMLGVDYSWRFAGGFTCSYSDGTTRTSYWF